MYPVDPIEREYQMLLRRKRAYNVGAGNGQAKRMAQRDAARRTQYEADIAAMLASGPTDADLEEWLNGEHLMKSDSV